MVRWSPISAFRFLDLRFSQPRYRCEGEGNAVRAFNAFAPAALAGIGSLPATLRDRSVLIPLVPAQPGQIAARFDPFHIKTKQVLARKLARWTADNFAALAASDPPLPPGAFNRLADNWRPLLAIAQVAGGDWPRLALEAFAQLTGPAPAAAAAQDPNAIDLLADIRAIFAQSGSDRLSSKQLITALRALSNRPWSTAGGQPIDEAWLAQQLRQFDIAPRAHRFGNRRAKGYSLAEFPSSKTP